PKRAVQIAAEQRHGAVCGVGSLARVERDAALHVWARAFEIAELDLGRAELELAIRLLGARVPLAAFARRLVAIERERQRVLEVCLGRREVPVSHVTFAARQIRGS